MALMKEIFQGVTGAADLGQKQGKGTTSAMAACCMRLRAWPGGAIITSSSR